MDELWSSRSCISPTGRVQLGGLDGIKIGLSHMAKTIVPELLNLWDAGLLEIWELTFSDSWFDHSTARYGVRGEGFRWIPMPTLVRLKGIITRPMEPLLSSM